MLIFHPPMRARPRRAPFGKSGRARALAILLGLALLLIARPAQAALTCTIAPAPGNYGNVDVLPGTGANVNATVSVNCSGGTPGQIAVLCIEFGQGAPDSSNSVRYMGNGGNTLVHDLYTSSSYSTTWGSWGYGTPAYGSGGVAQDPTIDGSGNAAASLTVYGQVSGGQPTAVPGGYTWTNNTPALTYAQAAVGSSCATKPAGSATVTAGASNWTATVISNCYLGTSPVSFGTVGVLSGNVDSTTVQAIGAHCSNGTPYAISFDAGQGPGATIAARVMTNGALGVVYSLYQDAARSTLWGNTAGSIVSSTGNGNYQFYTVYGRVPPQTTPAPGAYSDTITVTITF